MNGEVKTVKIKNGRVLKAGIVVIGMGARPLTHYSKEKLRWKRGGIKT